MTVLHAQVTERAIRALVDEFCARVRRELALGPVFANALAEEAGPTHLDKIYAFRSSVMLTSGRYKSNPVGTHHEIAGLTPSLFGDWLDLSEATVAALFEPGTADRFACIARRIAESPKLALFFQIVQPRPQNLRSHPAKVTKCI